MVKKTIYNRMFQNLLCEPFIKGVMTNVRKMLLMNIIMSPSYRGQRSNSTSFKVAHL